MSEGTQTLDLARAIADLHGLIAEQNRRIANLMRPGKVTEVDYGKGLVKVKVGDLDSQWVPWMEQAGAIKTWSPPSVGQQVHLFSPSGEPGQGWVMPGGYSDANPQPHAQGGEQKIVAGKIILVGEVVVEGAFKASGGTFTHEGVFVGNSHTHTQVLPGAGLSGPPPG